MEIAIIIAAYNSQHYLPLTIESVLAQTFSDWQLLIINDGSTDGTEAAALKFAASDSRIRVITQTNGGQSAARNRGIREMAAQVEMVMILDNDDLLEPDALERLYAVLQEWPNAVAAHGTARFIDSKGAFLEDPLALDLTRKRQRVEQGQLQDCPIDQPTTFEVLAYTNVIWSPGQVLIRRDALMRAREFDIEVNCIEDWDMWIRLSLFGEFAFLDYPVFRFRRHENNQSHNERRMREVEYIMRRKHFASLPCSPTQKQILLQGYQLHEAHHRKLRWQYVSTCFKRGEIVTGAKQTLLAIQSLLRSSINRPR